MNPLKHPPGQTIEAAKTSIHRILPCILMALTLGLGAGSAFGAANSLVNPGFELGTTGWAAVPPWTWNGPAYDVENTNTIVYGGAATNKVIVHGGTNAFKVYGYFQPYTTTPGGMQTFAASPGSTWTASAWASTQIPNTMTSTESSFIEIMFLDATTNYSAPLATFYSAAMTPSSPQNTYLFFAATNALGDTNLTAPAGTAFIRYEIIFSQPAGYPGGSTYWDDAVLLNTSKPDPEITVQPLPTVTVNYGQTTNFSVVADGLTTLSYKWQKDNADISDPNAYGVTTATLTLSNVTTASQGSYTCIVSDQAGPLTSNPGNLVVNDPGIISITPPLGQTVTNGGTAHINVAASGSSALSFSWELNGNPIGNGGHVSGATTSNLTVSALSTADAGTYTVLVNGGAAQASSVIKVVPASQVATNLLINPGFEDGVLSEPWENGWLKFNGAEVDSTNNYYYLSATPVSVYDGLYCARTFASDPDNGIYENGLPAAPGATFHAGGWFYMSSFDPITGLANCTLQFMFKNAGGNTITTFNAPVIRTNFVTDTWTYLQVTNATGGFDIVAPAGTASATCQIYEYAQQGGGGSVYFDDLYVSLASVPAPPAFSISTSVSGGQINISFPTASGYTYDVLYSANAGSSLSTWQTNSTVVGDGTVKSVPDTMSAATRFYRVRAH